MPLVFYKDEPREDVGMEFPLPTQSIGQKRFNGKKSLAYKYIYLDLWTRGESTETL